MGGKAPYGFHTEPIKIDGINTKKLVANPAEAEQVKLMFEMYAEPGTSYGDIVRHFAEHGIKDFPRPALANILCNPIYGMKEQSPLTPRYEVVEQLKSARKAQNVTQEVLAERVGTKKSNISRFESGRYNPSLDFLIKVADSLGKQIQIRIR